MKPIYIALLILLLPYFIISSCKKDDKKLYDIFAVQADALSMEMNGVINKKSKKCFDELMTKYPNIKTINIINCDGSSDDETNLALSKDVHTRKMNIHLMDNGSIASGGVDFFLAGAQRTKGPNTKIGVHSWSDGNKQATDYPVGHSNHLPYTDYYKTIGFTQQEAEDFYYFTINAATADGIHWMTDIEIIQYNILK